MYWSFLFLLSIVSIKIHIIHSNVLITPCSTADPGIAAAVLIQNKHITKIERLSPLYFTDIIKNFNICHQPGIIVGHCKCAHHTSLWSLQSETSQEAQGQVFGTAGKLLQRSNSQTLEYQHPLRIIFFRMELLLLLF